ncbi:uncharacterized protein CG1161 [Chrysoperla carnea]|uniref:uncharacterized protein CG1161 n=1 Tax=Chrysoperla carnea TaxID=189513 RepID=UPI001D08E768|nr:uncharacterized protein CG1161 [Chrysoperla carnea]
MDSKIYIFVAIVIFQFSSTFAQSYENNRCTCVCPSTASVVNNTQSSLSSRKLYISSVPPNKCNCVEVVLPQVVEVKEKSKEFCPLCDCRYENRNTTIIKVVVIIVIWVISLLVIYMLFLICLDPLLNKRVKGNYQEHTNEDDEATTGAGGSTAHPMGVRGNVLNRVGHQQDKWKRQVREQRRNIYDRHTMLN